MSRALRIDDAGSITEITWAEGESLPALQSAVGGLIDVVQLAPDLDLWVHDEGLYLFEPNPHATAVATVFAAQAGARLAQAFHGPAVFTGGVDDEGDTLPLSEEQAEQIRQSIAGTAPDSID